ncbi:MAG: acyltransferase family protein [Pseudomonadota bacterium]
MGKTRQPNNIGLLRLIFASGVILTHGHEQWGQAPAGPDLLQKMTGNGLTVAALCVDAFFLISGYLIVQSMRNSADLRSYFAKRILRIYPAFIIAFLLSALLVPFLFEQFPDPGQFWRMTILQRPEPFLAGSTWIEPNSPMWTISYEFRCYILVALLGAGGWLDRREAVLKASCILFLLFCLCNVPALYWRVEQFRFPPIVDMTLGAPYPTLRLLSAFGFGACAYLYREELRKLNGRYAALAGALALAALFYRPIAQPSAMLAGGLLLYWVAFRADLGRAQRINDRFDISYGTYLYGFPLGIALSFAALPFETYVMATLVAAWAMGALSWILVERPAQQWRSRWMHGKGAVPT